MPYTTKRNFDHHKVWRPNFFNHQTLQQPKIDLMVTKKTFSHHNVWRSNFFNCQTLQQPKTFGCQHYNDQKFVVTLLYGDRNYSIAIEQWQSLEWWPNVFDPHPTHPHHHMAIKIFQLLKGVQASAIISEKQPMLSFLGNQKILVTIWWCGCVKWQSKFFGCHPTIKGMSNSDQMLLRAFQKHMVRPLFVATKKFFSPQGKAIKNISVTAMFVTENSLVATKGTDQISSITHPCGN